MRLSLLFGWLFPLALVVSAARADTLLLEPAISGPLQTHENVRLLELKSPAQGEPVQLVFQYPDGQNYDIAIERVREIRFEEDGTRKLFDLTVNRGTRFRNAAISLFENGQFYVTPAGQEDRFPVPADAIVRLIRTGEAEMATPTPAPTAKPRPFFGDEPTRNRGNARPFISDGDSETEFLQDGVGRYFVPGNDGLRPITGALLITLVVFAIVYALSFIFTTIMIGIDAGKNGDFIVMVLIFLCCCQPVKFWYALQYNGPLPGLVKGLVVFELIVVLLDLIFRFAV